MPFRGQVGCGAPSFGVVRALVLLRGLEAFRGLGIAAHFLALERTAGRRSTVLRPTQTGQWINMDHSHYTNASLKTITGIQKDISCSNSNLPFRQIGSVCGSNYFSLLNLAMEKHWESQCPNIACIWQLSIDFLLQHPRHQGSHCKPIDVP